MKTFKDILALILVIVNMSFLFGQNLPPEIVASGNQNYCAEAPMFIVESVSISDADASDTTLDQIFIQISEGYVLGSDVLQLSGSHSNISATWQENLGQLLLSGTATFAEYEAAILAVTFTTTQTVFTADRSFSINLGNANYLPSTDHYYFYISSLSITWEEARVEAETQDYFGLQGYLATITTPEEAQLVGEQATGAGWIGATDQETEGLWKWVTGPESGTEFWQGQVSGTPIGGLFSFWNTGEPNNFGGNEDYAHITDPSIGILGSWNDLPVGGDASLSSPYHPKGYIIEFGGMPGDPDINLSAATNIIMPRLTMLSNVEICQGEEITLSVESNIEDINWFADASSAININTGNTYTNTFNTSTILYVSVSFSGCGVEDRRPIEVNVLPRPEAVDTVINQCDDLTADGISNFRLNTYSGIITNASTTSQVSYFLDAALSLPIDDTNFNNTVNNQIVYARVEEPSSGCFSVAEVTLGVGAPSLEVFNFENCDDEEEDGLTMFDLSEYNTVVLADFPITSEAFYFSNYNDALLNENQLPNLFTNLTPYNQTVFVKIVDGINCLGINEVNLEVNPLPTVFPNEIIYYCLDTFPNKIVLNSGVNDPNPNNFYYNWSTGETTIDIEVNTPGSYTVEIIPVIGCSNTRTITVLPSGLAQIETVDVIDAVENNSVLVVVSGDGDYEYALNSETGPYQDFNLFHNVQDGMQTIFVRDKNGCGISSKEFPVIGFPEFFTPNGDSNNDVWTINAFQQEFLANTKVKIFNRYGKLITELTQSNQTWNGTYNGKLMPADDYWFSVTFTDGRSFSNHFTLKR